MIELLRSLSNNLGYILLIAFLVSNINVFKTLIQKDELRKKNLILLSLIFGAFGILGTYTGTEINGAIANTRIIGIMSGGILCGPFVGITSGLIAGIHRFLLDPHGITTIPCSITTIISGLVSGYIYTKSDNSNKWAWGFFTGLAIQSFEMILIMFMVPDFNTALNIVRSIYFPMSFANAIGIAILILIIQRIFKEKDEISAEQAQIALEIANKTLPHFREMDENSLENICSIIKDAVCADAVAITDRTCILAHVGIGSDHHIKGNKIETQATKKVIIDGQLITLSGKDNICCNNPNCQLKSALISPLKEDATVSGTLKIYYCKENAISYRNVKLAAGLSQLISTQLEISKLGELKNMANKAEIKALQAQINPHFLFNALNTIVSFIRINPDEARKLIINLSTYLRHNIESGENFVDINKEIEQVKAYVEIEKARFGDKLNVIYDIEENLDIKIPSLIIQPLVENSIKHGILEGSGSGSVSIKIRKIKDDSIQVCIEDDGCGISKEIIKGIYNDDIDNTKIGLLNVHKRLKCIYGQGLFIDELDYGSRIVFTLKQ
ncbi:sensor histidine kinase [Proteocatella sphenisci]|uniref:sensor histidine kinase n=1 Tax=Proteocatella sphenisci TaxID=181070 RepID=UPI00048D7DFE|nr:sensor histidine kinase [Proteocatella sphenisci]